jgi:hypothetical protein
MMGGRASGPVDVDEAEPVIDVRDQVAAFDAAGIPTQFVLGSTYRSTAGAIAEAAENENADGPVLVVRPITAVWPRDERSAPSKLQKTFRSES